MKGGIVQTATATVTTILSSISEVFNAAIGWVGTVGETIVENPLLLIFTTIGLVGLGVGLFKRLLHI